jgi:molybdopterin converting factor small subunit
MSTTIEVRVLLRATLARYGKNLRGPLSIDLPQGSLLAEAIDLLGVPREEVYLCLINNKGATLSDELRHGDQIELVPPIAGG